MKKLLLIPILLFILTACGEAYASAPAVQLDRSQPLASSNEFVTVAYDSGVTMQLRTDTMYLRVTDANGNVWESTPHDVEDDPLARGMIRMTLSSMITVSFLSGAGNMSHETAAAASVRSGNAQAYLIPNGVRVDFYFPAQRTLIPLEVTLESGTMLAQITPSHIQRIAPPPDADEEEWVVYNRNHRLMSVGILPNFIHAGLRSEGYILVPDGSGAVMYLNNGRPRNPFSQPVFGRDSVNPPRLNAGGIQDVLLPVVGMRRDNAAIFAIIESGAALATISAGTSGFNSSYNTAGVSFQVRPPGSYTVTNAQGVMQEILVTTPSLVGMEVLSVRYHFMADGASYADMAQLYRQHLIAQGLTPTVRGEGLPLILDIYGSVTRRMSVLGVPRNRNVALTSFEQSAEMVQTIRDGGVDNIIVRYNNWLPRGNYSTAPARFSPSRSLGGNSGFQTFASEMDALNVRLYMDADFTTAHRRPLFGFIGAPIIRDIANMPVRQNRFDPATFATAIEPYPGWWLYAPSTHQDAVSRFVSNANGENITGLSLSTLSNNPYSDTARRNLTDRGTAEAVRAQIAENTRASFNGLMGDAAGGFWLPHASVVVNTPIGCSGFTVTDRSVPFYQMVLHGYVDFSLPAYNLSADRNAMVLRAAETGALLQISVIAENPALLVETPLEWLFSPSFDYWYSLALQAVHRLAPVYNNVAGSPIVGHSAPASNVARTVFANGTIIYVNYNHEEITVSGRTLPARDFIVLAGGVQ